MWIDILYILVIIIAIVNGYKNGFIGAVLSTFGVIIGLAAALKMSAVIAKMLGEHTSVNAKWLPFIAFALVFLLVMLGVKILIKAIETTMSTLMIGWANRIMGMLLYAFIYTAFFSVAIFYYITVSSRNIAELSSRSLILPMVIDFAPWILDTLSGILPFLKSSFEELQEFFGNWSHKLESQVD
ncbi:CvpA family protein [Gynurincola endophyticus]|jgi:membrane protein required for colicin V production|uniref:CvpA family protein n=1 Tax=Gynurincola endophyticus TaxID=2479004 RepID=UPI000F8CF578|nr:CvpA family protein [Gynurincola endophyticus]